MKIWELDSDRNGYESIALENRQEVYPKFFENKFNGQPINEWGDILVKSIKKGKSSDHPDFSSGMPVFSEKFVKIIKHMINEKVQILPLKYINSQLFIVNIINVIDCIDYEKADVSRLSTGTINGFRKYAFKIDDIQDEYIFKIPEQLKTKVFVTDAFRNKVIENGLKGFKFIEVWDSEEDVAAKEALHQQYLKHLERIEKYKGQEYPYIESMHMVNAGKAIVSGKFKLQQDKTGNILLGNLQEDGSYAWIDPIAYPPIFHDMKWHVVERSDI